jgi:hypothetical protein
MPAKPDLLGASAERPAVCGVAHATRDRSKPTQLRAIAPAEAKYSICFASAMSSLG